MWTHPVVNHDFGQLIVSQNQGVDCRQFVNRPGRWIIKPHNRHRNRRTEDGCGFGAVAIGGGRLQREVVFCAIQRDIGIQGNHILAAKERRQIAVNFGQLVGRGRFREKGVGGVRERLKISAICPEAESNRIEWHTAQEGGLWGGLAGIAADKTAASIGFRAVAQEDNRSAVDGRIRRDI